MNEITRIEPASNVPLFTRKLFDTSLPDASCSSLSSVLPFKGVITQEDVKVDDLPTKLISVPSVPIEDLENALFYCCKDYFLVFKDWTFSLSPFISLHPLVSLYAHHSDSDGHKIESHIRKLLNADPLLMRKYKWFLRVMQVLEKLSIKWKLFEVRQVRHRSAVGQKETLLSLCAKVNDEIFVPDVLYLAASHTDAGAVLPAVLHPRAATVTQQLADTVLFLMSLNQKVDYRAHDSITDYLYAGIARVSPELVSVVPQHHLRIASMDKAHHSRRIGFHLLSRPSLLSRCCSHNPLHAVNDQLAKHLQRLLHSYQDLEQELTRQEVG